MKTSVNRFAAMVTEEGGRYANNKRSSGSVKGSKIRGGSGGVESQGILG